MKLRPWLSPAAKRQIVERDVWWQTYRRSAPNAFWDELMAAIETLCSFPESGVPIRGPDVAAGTRRVLLPVSRAHVYFLHDDEGRLCVLAVSNAIAGKRPPLPKKRPTTRRKATRRPR